MDSGREKAVEIVDLTKLYKNNRGIKNINLDIFAGDIFAFLGPNGAGKTTAMKIMTGMMTPDSGDVKIFGASVLSDYEKAMASVGSIIETATTYPYLTAKENLKLAGRFYGLNDEKRIDEVLEITGIIKYKNEK